MIVLFQWVLRQSLLAHFEVTQRERERKKRSQLIMYDWWCNSIYGCCMAWMQTFTHNFVFIIVTIVQSTRTPLHTAIYLPIHPKKRRIINFNILMRESCVCVTVINKFDTHCLLNTVYTRICVFVLHKNQRAHTHICTYMFIATRKYVRQFSTSPARKKSLRTHNFLTFFVFLFFFGVLKIMRKIKCNATQIILFFVSSKSYAQFIDVWTLKVCVCVCGYFFDYYAQALITTVEIVVGEPRRKRKK